MKIEIKVAPPGPKAKEIIEKDEKLLATATKTSPVVAESAKGVYVKDVDGNIYMDFTCGAGVTNTGHCHPKVIDAIKEQVEKLMHFAGTDFYYSIQVNLAEKLTEITPGKYPKKVFFTNSGTESVETAIKLCRWHTNRKCIIGFLNAFHGRTMGSLSITASKIVHREKYLPMMPCVFHVPSAYCYRCRYKLEYPKCDIWCAKIINEVYFESLIPPDDVCAIFIEPVQGEGGYIVPPKEFVREVRKIADEYDLILVDDEIQTGFGRTGKWFAIEHFDVIPDVVTIAKGMGSGMPIGATVFRSDLDFGVPGAQSNTYGGNLVACASSLATIKVIDEENLIKNAERVGEHLHLRLLELQDKYDCIDNVRGLGLMQATEIVKNPKTKEYNKKLVEKIVENAYKRGLLLLPCGHSAIRYIPPLIITKDEVDSAMEILDDSIKASLD